MSNTETTTVTKEQVAAYVQVIGAVGSAIRELGQVPSGHLYARLMGIMSLDRYHQIIDALRSEGLVSESEGHMLTWTGGKV